MKWVLLYFTVGNIFFIKWGDISMHLKAFRTHLQDGIINPWKVYKNAAPGMWGFCALAPTFVLQTGEKKQLSISKGSSRWADAARVMVPPSKGTWLLHPVSGKLQPESCSGDKSNHPGWKQNKTKQIHLSKFRQEVLKQDWTHQGLCKKTIIVLPYYLPLLILPSSLFPFWPHVTPLSRRPNWDVHNDA